jgi:hypothetical protein
VLAVYLLLSTAYSFYLKTKLLVDVMVLAGLYTLRIAAGGAAAGVTVSRWMDAFSIFLFVSLAFAKRYTELSAVEGRGESRARGRNYEVQDLRIIEAVGPASGYLAVLVMALYLSDAVQGAGFPVAAVPAADVLGHADLVPGPPAGAARRPDRIRHQGSDQLVLPRGRRGAGRAGIPADPLARGAVRWPLRRSSARQEPSGSAAGPSGGRGRRQIGPRAA